MMFAARAARSWSMAAGIVFAAVIAAATPAAANAAPKVSSIAQEAATTRVAAAATGTSFHFTAVPAGGRVSCYGYYGTFKEGSYVMVVDWIHTSDECFGISTDRTIWHAWPNSGGWKKMGGNGLADDIAYAVDEGANGSKGVVVWVSSSNKYWVQRYAPPLGWTGEWTLA
ncbi:hypothetical protein QRX60_27675 [Amycolatopsis mongoliensis]|uniref:Secreted protein n=1 Tax=Amycolatopsis mongoliensis TaxID=715475 RepID=A0A9Y2JIE7_9PSEU|nr:hypothetical protein [Amycolatopsis sp. 4-36]WIX97863.1 hypothetical protein QRX60_27675 [Amycolatopsis sp. 4-36]